MPAVLLPNGKQQFFTTPGVPAVGYKLATFAAGTSTPQATWADALQVGANTNPIILDARGEAVIFWNGAYKVQLQDSTGAVIWTVDNVTSTTAASLIPSADNTFTLGSLAFSWANLYLGANHAPAFDVTSGNIGYVARTAAENSAAIVPTSFAFPAGNPNRYPSAANWAAVYTQINTLARYSDGWYRSDHAQHPSLTNAIVGFGTYDDSQLAGTIGYRCTAMGALSMLSNKSSVSAGGSNSAFGYATLESNIDGSGNSCFGAFSLQSLTGLGSSHNNAFGYRALTLLVNGTQNEVFGFQGINSLTTGSNNHAFGENVLQGLTNGNGNHHFGYQAGFNKGIGDFSHAFGYQALTSESQGNITAITLAVSAVITINTVSVNNPFTAGSPISFEGVGGMTQINGVIGAISAVGGVSGAWTATTNINSSGFSAFTAGGAIFPVGNSAFGYQTAASLNLAGANTVMGWQAGNGLGNPLDFGNTLFGFQAGVKCSTAAVLNVAIGYQALPNCITGSNNTCVGQQSGTNISSGSENICIGDNSGNGISTANQSVSIGAGTCSNLNGAQNTAVGFNAGTQGAPQTFTNTSSFGNGATPTASNQVTLGNSSVATLRCQQTTITALSDERFKQGIATLDIPDAFLEEVRIVSYRWLGEELPVGTHVGVIAQELDALQEKYDLQWLGLVDKSNPDKWEATPGKLLFPLIQYAQKQKARMDKIEARLAALEAT